METSIAENITPKTRGKAQLAAKRRNESLERRIETLIIKSHELWVIFGCRPQENPNAMVTAKRSRHTRCEIYSEHPR
jgi:hypothetical protein